MLDGKDSCMDSLLKPPEVLVIAKTNSPHYVRPIGQLHQGQYIFVFAYLSLLVAKGRFKVFVSFLLVGHTHNDNDVSFGW